MNTAGRQTKKGRQQAQKSGFHKAAEAAGLSTARGKSAVKGQYQAGITCRADWTFTDSVDVDLAYTAAEPESVRWDYGLGLNAGPVGEIAVWVEPHPASSTRDVAKVIAKLDWLEAKLALATYKGLRALTDKAAAAGVRRFHWLAMTGGMRIRPGSREANLLSRRGLQLPRRHLEL